jgi:hypothetical protein
VIKTLFGSRHSIINAKSPGTTLCRGLSYYIGMVAENRTDYFAAA